MFIAGGVFAAKDLAFHISHLVDVCRGSIPTGIGVCCCRVRGISLTLLLGHNQGSGVGEIIVPRVFFRVKQHRGIAEAQAKKGQYGCSKADYAAGKRERAPIKVAVYNL